MLPAFGDRLGEIAQRRLEKMGVDVQLGGKVVDIDSTGIEVEDCPGREGLPPTDRGVTKVWAAGVKGSALGAVLAEQTEADLDRAGRI